MSGLQLPLGFLLNFFVALLIIRGIYYRNTAKVAMSCRLAGALSSAVPVSQVVREIALLNGCAA